MGRKGIMRSLPTPTPLPLPPLRFNAEIIVIAKYDCLSWQNFSLLNLSFLKSFHLDCAWTNTVHQELLPSNTVSPFADTPKTVKNAKTFARAHGPRKV